MAVHLIGIAVILLMYFSTVEMRLNYGLTDHILFKIYFAFFMICLIFVPYNTSKSILPNGNIGDARMYIGIFSSVILFCIVVYLDFKVSNEIARRRYEEREYN